MNCESCGAPLQANVEKCPYCGAIVESEVEKLKRFGKLPKIKRVSLAFTILITPLSWGLYGMYWIFTRKKTLNSLAEEKVAEAVIWAYVAAYILISRLCLYRI
ncbi:MAG: zinc-ribbon domain-containing protein [Synergistaceae bacterium]|nr:zinc-ribbon domain-containing protein [Synergistaceae bacterium]